MDQNRTDHCELKRDVLAQLNFFGSCQIARKLRRRVLDHRRQMDTARRGIIEAPLARDDSPMTAHHADIGMYVRRPSAPSPGSALGVLRTWAKCQCNEAHTDIRAVPRSVSGESVELL